MTTRRAQRAAERAHKRIVLEIQNRTLMLCVHGLILMLVGLMMATTGAPLVTEEWFGPWSRIVVGSWAIVAGAVSIFGVALSDDIRLGWRSMLVGSLAGGLWHLGLASTYGWAAITTKMSILLPGEPLGSDIVSRGYIPFIYLGYVLLIAIHAVTLIRLGPPPR